MGNVVRNNSFSIYEGQITGVFGLIGSGRTETFKIVAGIYKRDFLRRRRDRAGRQAGALSACRAKRCATASSTSPRTARSKASSRRWSIAENSVRRLLAAGREAVPDDQHARDARRCRQSGSKTLNIKRHQRQCARRRALRRQPAEGGDRQRAGAEAAASSSSTSRPAASMSAPSPRSTSSSTGWPTRVWPWS